MTLEEEAKRCFQWRWALICSSFVPTSMNLNWNGRPILYASTRATLMSCTTICQMWVLWNTYIRNSSLFGTEFQKQQKCLIWNDLYHKAFLGVFLTLFLLCQLQIPDLSFSTFQLESIGLQDAFLSSSGTYAMDHLRSICQSPNSTNPTSSNICNSADLAKKGIFKDFSSSHLYT